MKHTESILEFNKIKELLQEYAYTEKAKNKFKELKPYLSERELSHHLKETTEARCIVEQAGTPPIVGLEQVEEILITAEQEGCLLPEQLEYMASTLVAVRRLKDFLNQCKTMEISLAYYEQNLEPMEDIKEEIHQKIRSGRVDDYASKTLRNLRQEIERIDDKMRTKAEGMLRNNKQWFSDQFVTMRSGHVCLPVKKEYKFQVNGSVIDKSSTGATLFIEPTAVAKLNEELMCLKLDEENEERRILYTLTALISEQCEVFRENIRVIEKLDYIFAKGKLSYDMDAIEPIINTDRELHIVNGRHPFLDKESCVPLNIKLGGETRGIIITGPNTGGKTVAIKTAGLLSYMAQSGLHVPCERGVFTMNNQVLCDIGDGQNMTENLSTFSAHIQNVMDILRCVTKDSLVILDELGSGTDPAEGMGIAIAILEELRKSGCLFLVTTHYPEVKEYASKTEYVMNARMAFDRDSLRPLYRLEIGEAGESCAFYIAHRLGMPASMLKEASMAAYGEERIDFQDDIEAGNLKKESAPKIQRKVETKIDSTLSELYHMGDSVMISPEQKIGIVCKPINEKGMLQVQLKGEKQWLNHKRVKMHVKAEQLYPEDYDFSIVFDSVKVRKARHDMGRKHVEDGAIEVKD